MLSKESGFVFLEVLIVATMAAITLSALLVLAASAVTGNAQVQAAVQEDALAKEILDSARAYRDSTSWSSGIGSLTAGSLYHFNLNTGTSPASWQLATGAETVNGYTRKIVFAKVSRDPATGNIETTYNASHDDPDTRKVTATVSNSTKSTQIVTYFTNWQK